MTLAVRAPDLEMQVRTKSEHGKTWLKYTLDSPTGAVGFSRYTVAGPVFYGNPDEFHRYFSSKIEQLGDSLDFDGSPLLAEGVDRKLVNLGRVLWRELIPSEIRTAYRDFRQTVHSWLIISDEPWIPWELIKPYDDSRPEEILDDDFLGLKFELTRWLAGKSTPARELTVHCFAALEVAELPHAREERILLEDLARSSPGLAGQAPPCESADDLLSYLETSEAQLLHFMGHGTQVALRADEAGLPLPDGSSLRPLDLEGPVATQILRNHPLVFQNTCWAGQQGWSLTRLGGWASRWIGICGCSAFVAPMWPVRDQIALSFARAFYGALASGDPLGKAAWKARHQIYQERSGDPSVLAYAVYGHPHMGVRFGVDSSAEEILSIAETPRGRPIQWTRRRSWRWRPWWTWEAAAVILAGLLHLSAEPILDRFFTMDVSPQPISLMAMRPKPPVKAPQESEPTRSTRAATEVKVGGLRFVVSGGSSQVNSALRTALSSAAKALSAEKTSGWTVTLRLDPPTITSFEEFGTSMVSCRLTGEISAAGPGAPIDLGSMSKIISQTNEYSACNAASKALAKAVVSELIPNLGTEGEI